MELREILLNRDDGAAQLFSRAVDWLDKHPEALSGARRQGTLDILYSTRPAMAAFARLAQYLAEGHGLADLGARMASADSSIATQFLEEVRRIGARRMATLSWSSTVLNALLAARGQLEEVHVLESLPGGEGWRLHRELGAQSIPSFLHKDCELERVVQAVDAGVMGADTVYADGAVLNKVLSVRLGEVLRDRGKALFVVASTWKNSGYPGTGAVLAEEEAAVFEMVPATLLTRIISEKDL